MNVSADIEYVSRNVCRVTRVCDTVWGDRADIIYPALYETPAGDVYDAIITV